MNHMSEEELKALIDEFAFDFDREKDTEYKALLIKDAARKLLPKDSDPTYPLPKNLYVAAHIMPEYYFEIMMPMHMVKVKFLNSQHKAIGDEYKSFPYINRAIVDVDGIPAFLIKTVKFSELDWNSIEHAKAYLYVYDAGQMIFDIEDWFRKHLYAKWKRIQIKN